MATNTPRLSDSRVSESSAAKSDLTSSSIETKNIEDIRREAGKELVAQLQLPRLPGNNPLSNTINQNIVAPTERFANDRIEDAKKLVGEGQRQLQRLENTIETKVREFQNSSPGQLIQAPVRLIQNYGREAVEAVRSGQAVRATVEYLGQIPGAVQTVMENPVAFARDVKQFGPQIIEKGINAAAVSAVSRAFDGFPENLKEKGVILRDNKLGWIVTDGTVAYDIGDGRGNVGVQGFRVRTPQGQWSAPVIGTVAQDPQYGAIVVDGASKGGVAMTSQGLVVKEGAGWSAPYPTGSRAGLTQPDGSKSYGVVVVPQGAAETEKVFIRPNGSFQIESSARSGYSRAYSRESYDPVVLEGKVWAQDKASSALVNGNSKNEGLIRLPDGQGFAPPMKGKLVTNDLSTTEGGRANFPGVQLYEFNGKSVNGQIIALGRGLYRVEQGGELGLSGALVGYPGQLKGQWGINQVSESGDEVFRSQNGVQVKSKGARDYSPPVIGGEVVTIADAKGKPVLGVMAGDETPVNPRSGALRNNVIYTSEGTSIRRPDGQFSVPLPGNPTVLDGAVVLETSFRAGNGQTYKVVSDGENIRLSDGKTHKGWTPLVQGSFIELTGHGVGIELKSPPGAAVFAGADGHVRFALKSPSGSWSKPLPGELQQIQGSTIPVVKTGDIYFSNQQQGLAFYDQSNPKAGWRLLDEPKRPQETIRPVPTPLQQAGQFVEKAKEGAAYTVTHPGEAIGGVAEGTLRGLGDVLLNQTGLAKPTGNPYVDNARLLSSGVGEGALAYGVAVTSPTMITVGAYGARAGARAYSGDARQAVERGEEPTSVLKNPETQLRMGAGLFSATITMGAPIAPVAAGLRGAPAALGTGGLATGASVINQAGNNATVDPKTGKLSTSVDGRVALINGAEFATGQQLGRLPLGQQVAADLSVSTVAAGARSAVTGKPIDPQEAAQTFFTAVGLNIAGARLSNPPSSRSDTQEVPTSAPRRSISTPRVETLGASASTDPAIPQPRPNTRTTTESSPANQQGTDARMSQTGVGSIQTTGPVPRPTENHLTDMLRQRQLITGDQEAKYIPEAQDRLPRSIIPEQIEVRDGRILYRGYQVGVVQTPSATTSTSLPSVKPTQELRTESSQTTSTPSPLQNRGDSNSAPHEGTRVGSQGNGQPLATAPSTPALNQLRSAREQAVAGNGNAPAVITEWQGLVRDPDGRFSDLHNLRWFENGAQPAPDLNNPKQRAYLLNALQMKEEFLTALETKNYASFTGLANRMHGTASYKSPNPEFPSYQRFWNLVVQPKEIGNIVSDLAVKYGDPLAERLQSNTRLPGTSSSPEFVQGAFMPRFAYPLAGDRQQYMEMAGRVLKELEALPPNTPKQEVVNKVADFVAYTTSPHYWGTSNFGVTMNMGNALLQKHGLNPIPHGVIDFALFGLEQNTFRKVFSDAVAASNPGFPKAESRTPQDISQNLQGRANRQAAELLANGRDLINDARTLAREVDSWNKTGGPSSPNVSVVSTFFKLDADLALPKTTAEQMQRFEGQLPERERRQVAEARSRLQLAMEEPLSEANKVVVGDRDRLLLAMQKEVSRDIERATAAAKERAPGSPQSLRELDDVVQRAVLVKNAMRFLGANEIREHNKVPLDQITRELPWYNNALLSNRPKDSQLAVIKPEDPRFDEPLRAPTTPSLLTVAGTVSRDGTVEVRTAPVRGPEVEALFRRYKVTKPAEESGMRGQISFGVDPADGMGVAIKQAPLDEGRLEAARLSRMAADNNPNLPRVRDVVLDEKNEDAYLVLDRGGKPVLDKESTRRSESDAVGVGLSVLNALETSHKLGIVHRDINPRNVLITDNDPSKVTLIDFGLAVEVGGDGKARGQGFGGVPAYMPPEQFARGITRDGESYTVDRTVDTYATAALIAHMAQGKPAFDSTTQAPKRLLRDPSGAQYENPQWRDHWETIHAKGPDLSGIESSGLREVLRKAMAPDPAQRYRSASEFANALRPFHNIHDRGASSTTKDPSDPPASTRENPTGRQNAAGTQAQAAGTPVGSALNEYRATLDKVETAIKNRDATSPELREFFREIVRDNEGFYSGLGEHNRKHVRSWFPGRQEAPQFMVPEQIEGGGTRMVENTRVIRYLEASLNARRAAIDGLAQGEAMRSFPEFKAFMNRLHGEQAYKSSFADPNHPRSWDVNAPLGTPVERVSLKEAVVEAATWMGDSRYFAGPIIRGNITGISPEGQPEVRHGALRDEFRYPDQKSRDEYMRMAQQSLIDISKLPSDTPKEEIVKKVADFVTYSTTPHYWAETNVGLTMNIANGILRTHGMRGIEHGVMDIYGMGLQPETVRSIFQSEVARSNMDLVTRGELRPPEVPSQEKVLADLTNRATTIAREFSSEGPKLTQELTRAKEALDDWRNASSQEEKERALSQVNLIRTLEAADRGLALPGITLRQLDGQRDIAPEARQALKRDVTRAMAAMDELVADPKAFFTAAHEQLWREAQRTVAGAREAGRDPAAVKAELDRVTEDSLYFKRALRELGDRAGDTVNELKRASAPPSEIAAAEARQSELSKLRKQFDQPFNLLASVPGYDNPGLAFKSNPVERETRPVGERLSSAREGVDVLLAGETPTPQQRADLQQVWERLVRDSGGRPEFKGLEESKFWGRGTQRTYDPSSEGQLRFMEAGIRTAEAFARELDSRGVPRDFQSFKNLVVELHKLQSYQGDEAGVLRSGDIPPVDISTFMSPLRKLGATYGDSTVATSQFRIELPGFAANEIPTGEVGYYRTTYNYPGVAVTDKYLQRAQQELVRLQEIKNPTAEQVVQHVGEFYRYGIQSHYFKDVNQSLFMNMANTTLERHGLKGIEHGMTDWAAIGLNERSFPAYFRDEVARVNPGKISPSPRPTTQEWNTEFKKLTEYGAASLEVARQELPQLASSFTEGDRSPSAISQRLNQLESTWNPVGASKEALDAWINEAKKRGDAEPETLASAQELQRRLSDQLEQGVEMNKQWLGDRNALAHSLVPRLQEEADSLTTRLKNGSDPNELREEVSRHFASIRDSKALATNIAWTARREGNTALENFAADVPDQIKVRVDPERLLKRTYPELWAGVVDGQPVRPPLPAAIAPGEKPVVREVINAGRILRSGVTDDDPGLRARVNSALQDSLARQIQQIISDKPLANALESLSRQSFEPMPDLLVALRSGERNTAILARIDKFSRGNASPESITKIVDGLRETNHPLFKDPTAINVDPRTGELRKVQAIREADEKWKTPSVAGLSEGQVRKIVVLELDILRETAEPKIREELEVLRGEMQGMGIAVTDFSTRTKNSESLVRKLMNGRSRDSLNEVTDLVGARYVFNTADDLSRATEVIEQKLGARIVEKDVIFGPPFRTGPYGGVHYIIQTPDKRLYELQLRTDNLMYSADLYHKAVRTPGYLGLPPSERAAVEKLAWNVLEGELKDLEIKSTQRVIRSDWSRTFGDQPIPRTKGEFDSLLQGASSRAPHETQRLRQSVERYGFDSFRETLERSETYDQRQARSVVRAEALSVEQQNLRSTGRDVSAPESAARLEGRIGLRQQRDLDQLVDLAVAGEKEARYAETFNQRLPRLDSNGPEREQVQRFVSQSIGVRPQDIELVRVTEGRSGAGVYIVQNLKGENILVAKVFDDVEGLRREISYADRVSRSVAGRRTQAEGVVGAARLDGAEGSRGVLLMEAASGEMIRRSMQRTSHVLSDPNSTPEAREGAVRELTTAFKATGYSLGTVHASTAQGSPLPDQSLQTYLKFFDKRLEGALALARENGLNFDEAALRAQASSIRTRYTDERPQAVFTHSDANTANIFYDRSTVTFIDFESAKKYQQAGRPGGDGGADAARVVEAMYSTVELPLEVRQRTVNSFLEGYSLQGKAVVSEDQMHFHRFASRMGYVESALRAGDRKKAQELLDLFMTHPIEDGQQR